MSESNSSSSSHGAPSPEANSRQPASTSPPPLPSSSAAEAPAPTSESPPPLGPHPSPSPPPPAPDGFPLPSPAPDGFSPPPSRSPDALSPPPFPAPGGLNPPPSPAPDRLSPPPFPAPDGLSPPPSPAPDGLSHPPSPAPHSFSPLPSPTPDGFSPLPSPATDGVYPIPSPAPVGFSHLPSPVRVGFSSFPAPDGFSPSPAPAGFSPPPKPSAMAPLPDNSSLAPSSFPPPPSSPSSLSPAPPPSSQSPSLSPSSHSLPPPPSPAPLSPLPALPGSNSPPELASSPAPVLPSHTTQPQAPSGTVVSRPPATLPLVPGTPSPLTPPNTLTPNDVPSTSKPPGQATPTTPNAKLPNDSVQRTSHSKNSESSHSSTKPSNSTINYVTSAVVGITAAGVFIVLVAVFFMITKKRRRSGGYRGKFRAHGSSTTKSSDGYYHGVPQSSMHAPPSEATPNSNPSAFPSLGSSYGSYGSSRYNAGSGSLEPGGPKSGFTFEEMIAVTNGFSRENLIGEGGFGCVYKGTLLDGRQVAVKQLKAGSGQGEREFKAEVEIISRIHHRHLVELVGYCISENHRLLVYEFVTNDTLEHHLHDKSAPVMDWQKRMKIAIGSARGLAYLHEDCNPKIIHRDIKSANILLDDSFEAKVADFGLAKLCSDTFTHVSTRVVGTFGYMAPEYAASGKLTDRSDVFSFGVVLLELITGRKSVDISQPLGEESLVEWARPLLVNALETGECQELVDPRLEKNYVESSMRRMIEAAAACVRHSAPKRPRMVQVLRSLDLDEGMSDLSNGVKFGHSRVYESNTDLEMLRKIAFGSQIYTTEGDVSEHV